jgi:hypothetical protein
MRLGTTASDLHAREGGEIGDNGQVMILTPRRSSGGGCSGREAAEQRAAEAWRRRRRLGENLGHEGGRGALACRPEMPRRRGSTGLQPNSGSSPSLAWGKGKPRQAGPACQREGEGGAGGLGQGGREQAGPRGKKGKKRPSQLGRLGCAGKREKRRKKRRERGPNPKKKRDRRKNKMLSIEFEI